MKLQRVCTRVGSLSVALLVVGSSLAGAAKAATGSVALGTADGFAVMAAATITNTGPTTITGDIGLSPGTAITGQGSLTLHGTIHAADVAAAQAQADLVTAYNDAAGRSPDAVIAGDIGGATFTPGVYSSASSLGITGTLTLDAKGDPNAVFIFQMGSTLITASSSHVVLTGGAQSSNVFWQVGSSATLGTYSQLSGSILALASITLTTGVTVDGRALARTAAVTMDSNTVGKQGTPVVTPPATGGAVALGSAKDFAVMAAATITNTGPTTITGDIGLSPGTAITGQGSLTPYGTIHAADAVAAQAQADLVTAYNDAAGRSPDAVLAGDLGGQTFTPGVYSSASSLGITGTLTLDAKGDPNAAFIFQMGSTLITASASHVVLTGGAQASNVFWQVGSSATLGTYSQLSGSILALASINLSTGVTVDGRALARTAAVTMDSNTVTRP
jgi:Ice-binding-like